MSFILFVANFLAVLHEVAPVAGLDRSGKLIQLQAEVDTLLFARETNLGEELGRSHVAPRKLNRIIHDVPPQDRRRFALDIMNFTVFDKICMPTNRPRFY